MGLPSWLCLRGIVICDSSGQNRRYCVTLSLLPQNLHTDLVRGWTCRMPSCRPPLSLSQASAQAVPGTIHDARTRTRAVRTGRGAPRMRVEAKTRRGLRAMSPSVHTLGYGTWIGDLLKRLARRVKNHVNWPRCARASPRPIPIRSLLRRSQTTRRGSARLEPHR